MRLLAMTLATCAALAVGTDAARAGETSGHHQATLAVMGPGQAVQATLVGHHGHGCGGYDRGPVVIQRYYPPYPTTIYRSYGYPYQRSYGYPAYGQGYYHGHSSGGFYYGGPRFGISIGF